MGRSARASSGFARRVVAWQRAHGRHDLPWQGSRDPYRVWLSEIMLQQTQVGTVLAYYERFLARFPDVQALARAPLDDVLVLWSGLGYYSRARNLHRCAQQVVDEHGGRWPASRDALARLPGIGPSTAAAIAAFCHGERVAILDGNVKRVLARHLGISDDLARPPALRALWARAEALLPDAADMPAYTQGLMDLGATVCVARRPTCAACPLRADCVAHRDARVHELPVKSRPIRRGRRSHALLWLRWRDQLLLVRRPERGVWAGLWSLPEFTNRSALADAVQGWGRELTDLPTIHHALTHFDWQLMPVQVQLPARCSVARREAIAAALPGARWFTLTQALQASLPAPVRRLLQAASAD
ncbi:MAG: A/G-specific adenine glycosylase [Burkholderiaceae bacterium]